TRWWCSAATRPSRPTAGGEALRGDLRAAGPPAAGRPGRGGLDGRLGVGRADPVPAGGAGGAPPGAGRARAGGGSAGDGAEIQQKIGRLPVVGDDLQDPFGRLAGVGQTLADAGATPQQVVPPPAPWL